MEYKDLFCDKSRWTKDRRAVDKRGIAVSPCDSEAASWSLDGAIYKVNSGGADNFVKQRLSLIRAALALYPERADKVNVLAGFNDHRLTTFADVLKVIDFAGLI